MKAFTHIYYFPIALFSSNENWYLKRRTFLFIYLMNKSVVNEWQIEWVKTKSKDIESFRIDVYWNVHNCISFEIGCGTNIRLTKFWLKNLIGFKPKIISCQYSNQINKFFLRIEINKWDEHWFIENFLLSIIFLFIKRIIELKISLCFVFQMKLF
jgi:hypothetical protein